MNRMLFSAALLAGLCTLLLAAPAAAQCSTCGVPTVAYSPVAVQACQPVAPPPVVVQERRCCLGRLCDWIWGRNRTVVAQPVVQTVSYAPTTCCSPCTTCCSPCTSCDPCSTCGSSPCACQASALPGQSLPTSTFAGSSTYPSSTTPQSYAYGSAPPATAGQSQPVQSVNYQQPAQSSMPQPATYNYRGAALPTTSYAPYSASNGYAAQPATGSWTATQQSTRQVYPAGYGSQPSVPVHMTVYRSPRPVATVPSSGSLAGGWQTVGN